MSRTILTAVAAAIAAALTAAAAHGLAQRPALSGPFVGSFTATLSPAQAAARGDSRMAGKFTLVIRRNGTYTASNPLDGSTRGRVAALSGKRLRFYNDSGCKAGGYEIRAGGVYHWAVKGKRLTLRLFSEGPCTGRTQTLTYPIWIRK